MGQRRHHYEAAFEAFLRQRRIPYVCVDEAKKTLVPPGASLRLAGRDGEPDKSLKSFDFVVYGQDANLLVEIKGRKVPVRGGGSRGRGGTGRLECWATRDDIASLSAWEGLFGPGFEAVLVFVYWCDEQPPDGLFQEICAHNGRWYALRSIPLASYRGHLRQRSARWGTVDLAAGDFERLSQPFAPAGTPRPLEMMDWSAAGLADAGLVDAGPGVPMLDPIG